MSGDVMSYQTRSSPTPSAEYTQFRPSGNEPMSETRSSVTWTVFNTIISGLVSITIVVLAVGFAWLHSDMSDIRTDIRDIRTAGQTTREDLLKAVGLIEREAATTNTKLDALTEELRRRR